jgi:hypothetical protein
VWRLTYWELWRLHWWEPRSFYTYPYRYHHLVRDATREFDPVWWEEQRARARRLVRDYLRVRPEILRKVDAFREARFAPRMLGVHMRGTDKRDAGAGPHLARIIPPAEYVPHIDRYLEQHPDAGVFLATDQRQFRDEMQARYGSRLVTYATQLSSSTINVFQQRDVDSAGNRLKGEEVLIDALLLAKCDFLLKCTSAVGEFAHYFAPGLASLDLNWAQPVPGPRRRPLANEVRTAAGRLMLRARLTAWAWWNDRLGMGLEAAALPVRRDGIFDTSKLVDRRPEHGTAE